MYKEAEQSYEKVLEFENTDDPELEEELNKVRSLQLHENDSENEHSKKEKTNFNSSSSSSSSTTSYHANENNSNLEGSGANPQNQTPSTSLWIGNVDPDVTEEILTEMFSQYGQLANVRCLPEKYCAFVNFKIKEDAHKAMQNLQVGSKRLYYIHII